MRNAKRCDCSFSQNNTSCMGERIRVHSGCSCNHDRCDRDDHKCGRCENVNRPKPCSRPCPRPCPKPCPRPCPKPCPSCEDRCAAQFRNCMRNCRWENNDKCSCGCGGRDDRFFDEEEFFDDEEGCKEERED